VTTNSQDPAQTPTVEDLLLKIQEQQQKITSLENTKSGLLGDLTKKKRVESLVKAAGIDLAAEDFEERVIQTVTALRQGTPPEPTPPAVPQQQGTPPATGETPSDAVTAALRAQLSSLQTRINTLETENKNKDEETKRERELRRQEILRTKVSQELESADCERPGHLFKLLEGKWRLLDDNETAVYGPEDDPIPLRDAATKLREDPEYALYFRGSGASGSGLPTSRTSTPMSNNPFAVGTANATEVARIMQDDPGRGRRLMQDARLAGKLDPVIARAFAAS
jgi:hypothetical protein